MQYLLDRLSERSTWVGIVAILSACGISIEPDQAVAIAAAGAAVAGAVNVFTKG